MIKILYSFYQVVKDNKFKNKFNNLKIKFKLLKL